MRARKKSIILPPARPQLSVFEVLERFNKAHRRELRRDRWARRALLAGMFVFAGYCLALLT